MFSYIESIGNISICTTDRLNYSSTKTASYNMVFVFYLNSSNIEEQKPSGNIYGQVKTRNKKKENLKMKNKIATLQSGEIGIFLCTIYKTDIQCTLLADINIGEY